MPLATGGLVSKIKAQTFAVELIDDVEDPEPPAGLQRMDRSNHGRAGPQPLEVARRAPSAASCSAVPGLGVARTSVAQVSTPIGSQRVCGANPHSKTSFVQSHFELHAGPTTTTEPGTTYTS